MQCLVEHFFPGEVKTFHQLHLCHLTTRGLALSLQPNLGLLHEGKRSDILHLGGNGVGRSRRSLTRSRSSTCAKQRLESPSMT
jgi:hypothetical protein